MSGSVNVTLTLLILGASVGKICHMLHVVTMNAKASSITTKVNGDTSTTTASAVLRGVLPRHHLCQVALAEHTRASIDAFILSCSLCAVHMQSTHAAILGAVLGLIGSALLFFSSDQRGITPTSFGAIPTSGSLAYVASSALPGATYAKHEHIRASIDAFTYSCSFDTEVSTCVNSLLLPR